MLSHCISTLPTPPRGAVDGSCFAVYTFPAVSGGNARAIFRTYSHDHYSKAEYYAGALPDGLGIRYDFKREVKQSLAVAQKVVGLRGGIIFFPHISHFKQHGPFKLLWRGAAAASHAAVHLHLT